jgi:hypothetical protein
MALMADSHLTHALERCLYASVGRLFGPVPGKLHYPREQRAHLTAFVETAMRTLRQVDHLFSPKKPLDEAVEFLSPHQRVGLPIPRAWPLHRGVRVGRLTFDPDGE